jgi:hypothetical protein
MGGWRRRREREGGDEEGGAAVAGRRSASAVEEANRHALVLFFLSTTTKTSLAAAQGDVTRKTSKQTHRFRRCGFLFSEDDAREEAPGTEKNCPGVRGFILFYFIYFFDEQPKRKDGGDGKPSQQSSGRRWRGGYWNCRGKGSTDNQPSVTTHYLPA